MASGKKLSSAPQRAEVATSSVHNQGRGALNLESAGPSARERDPGEKPAASSIPATLDPALVERLAYTLWEQRGRPDGSAEHDWLRAEQLLREDSAR